MITVIAEHSVDLSLLPEKANILDLGCRGFLFTNELKRLGHNVVAVDMDDLKDDNYIRAAVVGDRFGAGVVPVERTGDPQGTRIGRGKYADEYVETTTISKLTAKYCPDTLWDLIKMDVEGAEFEIIMHLDKAPAKQLSIEFHRHTITTVYQMVDMEIHLRKMGYEPVNHELSSQHGCGWNYWDSLFILQS